MALQLIIEKSHQIVFDELFENFLKEIEVFEIDDLFVGISIPSKIADLNDKLIQKQLKDLNYFDLWEGRWKNE